MALDSTIKYLHFQANMMRIFRPAFFCLLFVLLDTVFSYGQNWKALNPPLNIFNGTIYASAIDASGNVYAAGGFEDSSGYEYVAAWNGSRWSELGNGATGLNASGLIYSILTDKLGNVYAAGSFTNTSGKRYIAKWDGSKWSELGTGANALNANNAIFAITADK